MSKNFLFIVNGGLGRNIQSTAVIKALHQKYPSSDIYVMASYPEAFVNLDFIKKYLPNQALPYLYDEIKDFEILDYEPYRNLRYSKGEIHLVEAWCNGIGVDSPKDKSGQIELDLHEINSASSMLQSLNIPKGKPIIAIHFQGGTSYYNAEHALDLSRVKHYRDLPVSTAQQIVNGILEMGCVPLQIALPTEPKLENCIRFDRKEVINPRYIFAILNLCSGLVAIDSFAQHTWRALGKEKAIVMWGGTNPVSLGYLENINITSSKGKECPTLHCNRPDTYRYDIVGNGRLWTCKNKGMCMQFDSKEVIEHLKSVISPQKEK